MENLYWSWLPGIPKIMKWPVLECHQNQGSEVEVFCKADGCSYFIKRKQLSLFPGEFHTFKQKGIDCLKKKKGTLAAFLEDVEWALSMKRKHDSIGYHKTDDDNTNTQVHMMDKDDCVDKLVKEDGDKMETEDDGDNDKMEKEDDNNKMEKEDDNKMEKEDDNDKIEKEDDNDKIEKEDVSDKMEKEDGGDNDKMQS